MSTAQTTMRALTAAENGGALTVVTDRTAPQIVEPTDELIRVHSAALNPVDWKMLDHAFLIESWPDVVGGDMSGTVEAVGAEAAKTWKVSDKVWGVSALPARGSGTFAELISMRADLIYAVPDGMSMEGASTLPIGLLTAGLLLHHELKAMIDAGAVSVLIYGASASVGLYAVQLAAADGLNVVAVASKRNAPLLAQYGATTVLDYTDADWEAQAIDALGGAASNEGRRHRLHHTSGHGRRVLPDREGVRRRARRTDEPRQRDGGGRRAQAGLPRRRSPGRDRVATVVAALTKAYAARLPRRSRTTRSRLSAGWRR